MTNTKLLTGLSKIHISPDTGRVSISATAGFSKQVNISATIIEGEATDVFAYGLEIVERLVAKISIEETLTRDQMFAQIREQSILSKVEIDQKIDCSLPAGILRVTHLTEKELMSVTLDKPCIKRVKIVATLLEINVEQVLILSAEVLHAVLDTIEYGTMNKMEIYTAINSQGTKN